MTDDHNAAMPGVPANHQPGFLDVPSNGSNHQAQRQKESLIPTAEGTPNRPEEETVTGNPSVANPYTTSPIQMTSGFRDSNTATQIDPESNPTERRNVVTPNATSSRSCWERFPWLMPLVFLITVGTIGGAMVFAVIMKRDDRDKSGGLFSTEQHLHHSGTNKDPTADTLALQKDWSEIVPNQSSDSNEKKSDVPNIHGVGASGPHCHRGTASDVVQVSTTAGFLVSPSHSLESVDAAGDTLPTNASGKPTWLTSVSWCGKNWGKCVAIPFFAVSAAFSFAFFNTKVRSSISRNLGFLRRDRDSAAFSDFSQEVMHEPPAIAGEAVGIESAEFPPGGGGPVCATSDAAACDQATIATNAVIDRQQFPRRISEAIETEPMVVLVRQLCLITCLVFAVKFPFCKTSFLKAI